MDGAHANDFVSCGEKEASLSSRDLARSSSSADWRCLLRSKMNSEVSVQTEVSEKSLMSIRIRTTQGSGVQTCSKPDLGHFCLQSERSLGYGAA